MPAIRAQLVVAEARLAAAASSSRGGAPPRQNNRLAESEGRANAHAHCKLSSPVGSRNKSPHHQSRCKRPTTQPASQRDKIQAKPIPRDSSPLERFFTLLLPFAFVFLLPTIKLSPSQPPAGLGIASSFLETSRLFGPTSGATSDLLLALIRLPFDKIRLESGGLVLGADSKEIISSKSDLQEEETHMMLLAPAEHRSSYAPAGSTQTTGYHHYNQGGSGADSGSQLHNSEAHAQVLPAPGDYGGGESSEQSGQQGQGESTVVAESAGGTHNGGSSLQTRSDLPAVRALNVKCEKNHMTVNIVFDRPFYGMVFSKGHYNDQKCVHLPPNSGQTSINFDIHLGKCGMSSSDAGNGLQPTSATQAAAVANNNQQQPNGVFIENTIIIQYDPLVQEIYDQARKLRCTWYDYYEKSVTFRPYGVDMLDAVTANFLGDNIQCWMQIQVGKGPWSSEVAGIVKIGQTMTMVLAIKDDENRFDMLVRNCVAHDGKHQPIQLVDEYGCVARPKIMGKFQKVRNFGPAATVVSYAHFQAFKFPDSMNVHFQCVIQVCRYECPEPVCQQPVRGELPAVSSSGSTTNDYATSGTEMVASKELLPHQAVFLGGTAGSSLNQSAAHHHHGSNVNLKLDESQGRVQVKLDTSMMAALGSNGRPPVAAAPPHMGPLPPHLLHAHQQQQSEQTARNFLSPNHYRAQASSSSASAPTRGAHSPSVLAAAGPGRSPHDPLMSFSPQFPMAQAASRRSAAYTSRLGEMAANENATGTSGADQKQPLGKAAHTPQHSLDQLAPYEAEYPLSLIASPRGFFLGGGGSMITGDHTRPGKLHLHRVKREDSSALADAHKRQRRHLRPADSTSVQTHKSIQVVSPDDVAFSLLEPDDEQTVASMATGTSRRRVASADQASSVCFSASRFLWAIMVTLTVLISSIVIVTYIILRQRSQLAQKLSAVYPPDQFQAPRGIAFNYQSASSMVSQGMSSAPTSLASGHFGNSDTSALERQLAAQQRTICSDKRQQQQQQEAEAQQRNKYLARLYSQFSPASYWR